MPRTDSPSTGPMRFNGDWSGFFLRGDAAFELALSIEEAIKCAGDNLSQIQQIRLREYVRELRSCRSSATGEGQELKYWAECQHPSKEGSR